MSCTYRGHPVTRVEHRRRKGEDQYVLFGEDGLLERELATLSHQEFFSFPQLRNVPHGRHRRAHPKVHSSPARQSCISVVFGAIDYATLARTFAISTASAWSSRPREPAAIENAGIRAGEVMAWRAWRVEDGDRLCSVYIASAVWIPGEPMRGQVTDRTGGVHAFKELNDVSEYISRYAAKDIFGVVFVRDLNGDDGLWPNGLCTRSADLPYIVGRVALWGQIVEHERGYRAEFAKIASLDLVIGGADATLLDRVRKRYGVAA